MNEDLKGGFMFTQKMLDEARLSPPEGHPRFCHMQTSDGSRGAYLEHEGLRVVINVYDNGEVTLSTSFKGHVLMDGIDYFKRLRERDGEARQIILETARYLKEPKQ